MAKEIERKFLVRDRSFIEAATSSRHIRQTYLSANPDATVRLRIADNRAFITVKGRNSGSVRDEWEYDIPVGDAEEMASRLCGGFSIDKTRYIVEFQGWRWEVDLFHGRHEGLILAEVEMPSADSNPPLPPFIGKEVTGDTRYYNSTLSLPPSESRIEKEKRIISLMIRLYCRRCEGNSELCPDCRELLEYACRRLSRCPFGDRKKSCRHCAVHCYSPAMRERIRKIMCFSGPRMIFFHPIETFRHL